MGGVCGTRRKVSIRTRRGTRAQGELTLGQDARGVVVGGGAVKRSETRDQD